MQREGRIDPEQPNTPDRKKWHAPRLELLGQPAGGPLVGATEDGTYHPTS